VTGFQVVSVSLKVCSAWLAAKGLWPFMNMMAKALNG
jgi:hypothetical protein